MPFNNTLPWLRSGQKITTSRNPLLPGGTLNKGLAKLLENDFDLMEDAKLLEKAIKTHDHDDLYYRKIELQPEGSPRDLIHINKIFPKTAKSIYMLKNPFYVVVNTNPVSMESLFGMGEDGYVIHIHLPVPNGGASYYDQDVWLYPSGASESTYYRVANSPGEADCPRGQHKQPGTDGFGFSIAKSTDIVRCESLSANVWLLGVVR